MTCCQNWGHTREVICSVVPLKLIGLHPSPSRSPKSNVWVSNVPYYHVHVPTNVCFLLFAYCHYVLCHYMLFVNFLIPLFMLLRSPNALEWSQFLLCFSMNYRDFLGEIETDNFTVSNNESYDFWIFTVWDYFFLLYFMNSRLKVLPKMFKCSLLVWNYGDDVNVPRSNRWRHFLCWRNSAVAYVTKTCCRSFRLLIMVVIYQIVNLDK